MSHVQVFIESYIQNSLVSFFGKSAEVLSLILWRVNESPIPSYTPVSKPDLLLNDSDQAANNSNTYQDFIDKSSVWTYG